MSYSRAILPESFSSSDQLTNDLIGIGFLLAGKGTETPNIENTLIAASIEGMAGDFRVLSLLVDWIEIHGDRINAHRLIHLVKNLKVERVRCFWSATAQWRKKDHRFKKLQKLYKGPALSLLSAGTDFLIKKNGPDQRFSASCLLVPEKTLRHRPTDILTPNELAKKHSAYRWRITIGPTYRADMWATLENNSGISTSALARHCFGSFATAWQVKKDRATLMETRAVKALRRNKK